MMPAVNYLVCAVVLALSLSQTGWAQRSPLTAVSQVRDFARELVKAKSPEERNALLAARKELITIELRRELVVQGNILLLTGKYSAALDIYTLAKSVAGQINDSEGLASASLNIGTVNYFQGNHADALEHYQQARARFASLGNQAEAAKALSGLALIYKEQRKDREALMYSFIALAPGGSNQQDEGLLQIWEIVNLRSHARLLVLSGASINRERLGAGNAASGHAWAWFVAGTPATVVSRWEVTAPGVTQFMTEFHANVKKSSRLKSSRAEALRQSALTLRRSSDYQHPYFWSGFALLGDAR